jgi:hypothetical protein
MDWIAKILEHTIPTLPRWAQGLFAVVALSLLVFSVVPLETIRGLFEGSDLPNFEITKPLSGEFITQKQFSIEGTGARPDEDNVLSVILRSPTLGTSTKVHGRLTVNSNTTWRFDYVDVYDPGRYDLVIDAIFGGNKESEVLSINFEPQSSNGELPVVSIEGPATVALGEMAYFTIVSQHAVRGEWSLGGFTDKPVVVEPLGASHEIYVEPTNSDRIGHVFTVVFTAYGADGRSATAKKQFRVVSDRPTKE